MKIKIRNKESVLCNDPLTSKKAAWKDIAVTTLNLQI